MARKAAPSRKLPSRTANRFVMFEGESVRFFMHRVRVTKGDTQLALANTLGVTQATLSRYEAGSIEIPATAELAEYVGLTLDELTNVLELERLDAREGKLRAELEDIQAARASFTRLPN